MRIKVLLAKTEGVDKALTKKWMIGLGDEKHLRVSRLRHEKDKAVVVAAHRLLRFGLKNIFGITPAPDDWGVAEYGKPYLIRPAGIHFNISHSECMAMCALHDSPVGIDIEHIRPVPDGVLQRVMSNAERQAYFINQEKSRLFYQIWTLKEAYLKYSGIGLIDGLNELTICPMGSDIRSNVSGCQFVLIDNIPEYQAALCAAEHVKHSVEWVEREKLMDDFECGIS
ncbi:MAG: 4'-phosphopantetheinyl transferase family protein [Christensenellales bacterium]|jgi:4'-phosphopantetheinyl transferase